jgi:aromatic ring-opening dioxygenase LigB subunit
MSGLVFGVIAPHGHHAIPEACPPEEQAVSAATQEAMAELGRRFAAARPDVSIILTPHNVHVEGHMAVIMAGTVSGDLSMWADEPFALRCKTDRDLGRAAIDALNAAGIPTVGISYGGNDQPTADAPMDWGVLVPLWFMGGRSEPQVPTVVISPARDRSREDHFRAGAALAAAAAASGKRVALIASCDHGHGHLASGPYGFDPASAEFDNQIVELVKANRLSALREMDPAFAVQAKADSYWQMAMLNGAIGDDWQAEFLSYEHPTYFGMLCASFLPPQ